MIEYHRAWVTSEADSPTVCWIADDVTGAAKDIFCEDIPEGVEIIEHR